MTNGSNETNPLTYDASHFLRPCLLFTFISSFLLKKNFLPLIYSYVSCLYTLILELFSASLYNICMIITLSPNARMPVS